MVRVGFALQKTIHLSSLEARPLGNIWRSEESAELTQQTRKCGFPPRPSNLYCRADWVRRDRKSTADLLPPFLSLRWQHLLQNLFSAFIPSYHDTVFRLKNSEMLFPATLNTHTYAPTWRIYCNIFRSPLEGEPSLLRTSPFRPCAQP